MKSVKKTLLALIIPMGIIVSWYLAVRFGNVPEGILPSMSKVWIAFKTNIQNGQLTSDILVSLSRVVKGYLVAVILGIVAGSIIGMSKTMKDLLLPVITVIRQIPIIAWIPLIILWCGIGEESKVVIIVLAAFFPILVNTESGIEQTPDGFLEVGKLYKLNPWQTFVKVYLPHALPQMLVGLRLGLGVSWMAVVASELIAATSGIGYRMSDARSLMRADVVIVCMLVVGLIGVLMDKLIGMIFGMFTPWEKLKKA
ncbi:MAG: ABC transporter permease [Lachnospiraceae bacterium]|nr:ABC transporter permease [Lachnospiraceae bacterium]